MFAKCGMQQTTDSFHIIYDFRKLKFICRIFSTTTINVVVTVLSSRIFDSFDGCASSALLSFAIIICAVDHFRSTNYPNWVDSICHFVVISIVNERQTKKSRIDDDNFGNYSQSVRHKVRSVTKAIARRTKTHKNKRKVFAAQQRMNGA